MTKNQHLVPALVIDIGEAIVNNTIKSHIRENYIQRLEATIDYCQTVISKSKLSKKGVK